VEQIRGNENALCIFSGNFASSESTSHVALMENARNVSLATEFAAKFVRIKYANSLGGRTKRLEHEHEFSLAANNHAKYQYEDKHSASCYSRDDIHRV
jgi:hypothetical protein